MNENESVMDVNPPTDATSGSVPLGDSPTSDTVRVAPHDRAGLVLRFGTATALLCGQERSDTDADTGTDTGLADRLRAIGDEAPSATGPDLATWVQQALDSGHTGAAVAWRSTDGFTVAYGGNAEISPELPDVEVVGAVSLAHASSETPLSLSANPSALVTPDVGLVEGIVRAPGVTVFAVEASTPPPTEPVGAIGSFPAPTPHDAAPDPGGDGNERIDLTSPVDENRPPLPISQPDTGGDTDGTDSPMVRGLRCRNGHLNHPDGRLCSRCGDNLQNVSIALGADGSLGVLGARPPLGILTFDDGRTFQVERDLVVGRAPALTDPATDVITFPDDARMSREHIMIELHDWHVFLRDLNSSNGTAIRPPGASEYSRINPGEAVPLESGTVIVVGSRWVTFTATSAAPPA